MEETCQFSKEAFRFAPQLHRKRILENVPNVGIIFIDMYHSWSQIIPICLPVVGPRPPGADLGADAGLGDGLGLLESGHLCLPADGGDELPGPDHAQEACQGFQRSQGT